MLSLGCVPYANAIPLVAWFEFLAERSPVALRYEVPSRLPKLIDSGEVAAALVSSVDALRTPGRRMVADVCIGSYGPVKSVRLLSKVPLNQIRTLAWDASSLTSNRLAIILLEELHGVRPQTVECAPNLQAMLTQADACILIGDIGMFADSEGLVEMDLGEGWRQLTGLPFVWAAWIGDQGLTPELALLLSTAATWGASGKEPNDDPLQRSMARRWFQAAEDLFAQQRLWMLDFAAERCNWDRDSLRDYYENVIIFELTPQLLQGFETYREKLLQHGFTDCVHFPARVSGQACDDSAIASLLSAVAVP